MTRGNQYGGIRDDLFSLPLNIPGREALHLENGVEHVDVLLDRCLCFSDHMIETLEASEPVILCHNHLALFTKVTIYLLFLRSVLTYAAPTLSYRGTGCLSHLEH